MEILGMLNKRRQGRQKKATPSPCRPAGGRGILSGRMTIVKMFCMHSLRCYLFSQGGAKRRLPEATSLGQT